MYSHEKTQTPTVNPEALLASYDKTAEVLAREHEGLMRGSSRAHIAGATYWSDRGNDRLRFEEALKGTPDSVERLTAITASKVEELLGEMSREAVHALSPDDRRVLEDTRRMAEENGATDQSVTYATHNASGHYAQTVIDAALDIDRLHEVADLVREHGSDSNAVRNAISSGSSHNARMAISAAVDGVRLQVILGLVEEHGVDDLIVDRAVHGLDIASTHEAGIALDSALDGARFKEVERLAKIYGRADPRVEQILGSISNNYYIRPSVEAAMEVGKIPTTTRAKVLGRQALKNALPLRRKGKKGTADTARQGHFGGWDEDPLDLYFERAWFAGEWPFEGEGPGAHEAPPAPRSDGPDPYGILGVKRDATQEEIKQAYRQKAREHHTDVGGDEEAIKVINNANDMIKDPSRRAYFDEYGHLQGYEKKK